jgi:hypothetical protein
MKNRIRLIRKPFRALPLYPPVVVMQAVPENRIASKLQSPADALRNFYFSGAAERPDDWDSDSQVLRSGLKKQVLPVCFFPAVS